MRRFGSAVVALILIEYLAVPQIVRATSDLTILTDAAPPLLILAVGLEVCSVASYTALTRAVLPSGVRPGFFDQFRIDVTGLGFSHIVPGGGASAAALRFRLMTRRGVPPGDAAATAAVQTALAAIGLVATFAGGVVLAGPGVQRHPGYVAAGAGAIIFLLVVLLGMRSLGRRPPGDNTPPGAAVRASPVAATWVGRASGQARSLAMAGLAATWATARRARLVVSDPRRRLVVLAWAGANWVLDAASLWVCLSAYGAVVSPAALLMAYGAANLVGLLPLTPGGLGVVEGILVPALVALGGIALGPVTLGVLTWRLFEFWLPIPIAGLAYLTLRWSGRPVAEDTDVLA